MAGTKNRLIVLTDINRGVERDDIQSLVRLLLYSNEIDIEGLIATTSCFLKNGARQRQKKCILRIIHAYERIKCNLDKHAVGYPSPDYLRSKTFCGIPVFGKKFGKGFGEERWSDNEGVNCILNALNEQDERPLWIAIWGGVNTLAQTIWTAEQRYSAQKFSEILSKLRIYSISDQDSGGHWLRRNYGDKLFYIVSPSPPYNSKLYYKATWPGISADNFAHGYNGGKNDKISFGGADRKHISQKWIKENIKSRSIYGRQYPRTRFIMEGDTPSFLSLIPNGLNNAEHPDFGGWGGRYILRKPCFGEFNTKETHSIWTNAEDTVNGVDGRVYKSAQATIWRWREDFQNDFAMRMIWTATDNYSNAPHSPRIILLCPQRINAKCGQRVDLSAQAESPDGAKLKILWFCYAEAGTCAVNVYRADSLQAYIVAPCLSGRHTSHIVLLVQSCGVIPVVAYARVIIDITD